MSKCEQAHIEAVSASHPQEEVDNAKANAKEISYIHVYEGPRNEPVSLTLAKDIAGHRIRHYLTVSII